VLSVAVLGTAEVRRDGARLKLPAGKATELLVRLAVDAGEFVRTERLVEDLWSEQHGGIAPNTLQSKVSMLRRALGEPGLVTGGAAGYTLAVDRRWIDACEVLRLAESAAALRAAGDAAAAARCCATALAMFHGEVLPDGGDGAWLAPHRSRLEEVRLRLTEDHLAARIALGAAGQVIGELDTLVTAHPLREGLWRLLITALYQSGRQADALAAYRRIQRLLDDELGLDPGVELQALETQILRQDAALTLPTSIAGPTGVSSSLLGREADISVLSRLVSEHRLTTVVGPAGVGKTRLASELSAGGVGLVRLESARTAAAIWAGVGEALNLDAAAEATVLDRLRASTLLLVLDNCEHLVGELSEPVSRMLAAGPGVRVLATSQRPLGVDGEVVYHLEPLSVAESIELFVQRASQQRPSFRVDPETQPVVEAVCRSLDGLPLAIELAAARVRVLSVQEIARRLEDRFSTLSDPTSQRPERQRALGAAIAWSYDLLFPDDQRGLWALACFAGGAPLTAVESVLIAMGVPPAATVDVLSRLADRSLVEVDIGRGGAVRYRLLDSVRAFSLDQLRESDSYEAARRAHATWVAAAADRAATGVRGREQAVHLTVARTERANIDEALAWTGEHDPGLGLRIVNGFGWAWVILGGGVEAAARVRDAVAASRGTAPGGNRATGLLLAGWLEASGGNVEQATADIERATSLGGDDVLSLARLHLAFVHTVQSQPRQALKLSAACQTQFHRLGREWEEGASWLLSAWAHIALGALADGQTASREALKLIRPLGDNWGLSHAEAILGGLAQAEHRFADAVDHLERAADAAGNLGFGSAAAHHLTNLGRVHQEAGDLGSARTALRQAIAAAQAVGDARTAAYARAHLGWVLRARGEPTDARLVLMAAREWFEAAGGGEGAVLADYALAALDADRGLTEAANRLDEVLAAARRDGQGEVEVLTLDRLARLHAERGDPITATAFLAQADDLAPAVCHLMSDNDRIDRDPAWSLVAASPLRPGS
jgi:predicted ATPase/DNA-binding SARP family transcriptional activator/tetratricopeptide (TPR) repeat protein